jgi:hypothetical protein
VLLRVTELAVLLIDETLVAEALVAVTLVLEVMLDSVMLVRVLVLVSEELVCELVLDMLVKLAVLVCEVPVDVEVMLVVVGMSGTKVHAPVVVSALSIAGRLLLQYLHPPPTESQPTSWITRQLGSAVHMALATSTSPVQLWQWVLHTPLPTRGPST